jgi:polyhydroxyalkanoate synthesis regulator phasin
MVSPATAHLIISGIKLGLDAWDKINQGELTDEQAKQVIEAMRRNFTQASDAWDRSLQANKAKERRDD